MAGAQAGRPALPKDRADEEEGLARPAKAYPHELREEDAQTFVKLGGGGCLWSHENDDLLSVRTSLQRIWGNRCKLPYSGPSVQTLFSPASLIEHRLNGILSHVKSEAEVTLLDTCFTMPVVDVLCDERFQGAGRFPSREGEVGLVGPRLAEGVVEEGPADRPAQGRQTGING